MSKEPTTSMVVPKASYTTVLHTHINTTHTHLASYLLVSTTTVRVRVLTSKKGEIPNTHNSSLLAF
jgi:hypothetical protein